MNRFISKYKVLSLIGLLSISSYTLAHEAKDNNCSGYDRNVTQEIDLLSQTAKDMPAIIDISEAYQLVLKPQAKVTMLAEPHRISLDDASFAVILPLKVPATGDYRLSVSAESWVDVIQKIDGNNAYQVVASDDFNGRFECKVLRKLVEYHLDENEQYFVQITGAISSNMKLLMTPLNK